MTVAKMDATANDVPDARFAVKGFPSLYFYKAAADKAGVYTRPLLSSTSATSDTKCTLDTPLHALTIP